MRWRACLLPHQMPECVTAAVPWGSWKDCSKAVPSTELGQTLAMALAEVGQFDRAVRVQRDVMAATERAGLPDVGQAMAANLKLYESRKPSRTPWPPD